MKAAVYMGGPKNIQVMDVPDPVKFMESKGMTVSFLPADQVKAFADARSFQKDPEEGSELLDRFTG